MKLCTLILFFGTLSAAAPLIYHPENRAAYAAEAYFYSLIIKAKADRVDLQQAAWANIESRFNANAAAEKYLVFAEKNASTIDLSRFETVLGASGCDGSRPQESLTAAVPEPAWMHLLTGAVAVGLILLGRRRS